MTCAEFQHQLPDLLDEGGSPALEAHLKGCATCSEIATSLQTIIDEAKTLQSAHEPSPRVWNSIEIALRKEGLIRQPQPRTHRFVLPSFTRRWGAAAWLVPAAAALLVAAAVSRYKPPTTTREVVKDAMRPPAITVAATDPNDEQLLQEVAMRSPTMRETYESNLKDVNAYIQDAQDSVNADPNDEEAQQALMDAYGQKSMIYEMALDRSLP